MPEQGIDEQGVRDPLPAEAVSLEEAEGVGHRLVVKREAHVTLERPRYSRAVANASLIEPED